MHTQHVWEKMRKAFLPLFSLGLGIRFYRWHSIGGSRSFFSFLARWQNYGDMFDDCNGIKNLVIAYDRRF